MRRGIRKASRQSNPGSLLRLQRTVRNGIYGVELEPKTVHIVDVRNGRELMVSESETYGAVCNSFCTLNRRPFSVVMRELLAEGTTLANSKGLFTHLKRFRSQESQASDGLALSALRRAGEMAARSQRTASH
jgi:hypothetical protein